MSPWEPRSLPPDPDPPHEASTFGRGPRIEVELNGTVIIDADVSKVAEFMGGKPNPGKDRTLGHFGFAGRDDPAAFRDVAIKLLDGCSPTTRSPRCVPPRSSP